MKIIGVIPARYASTRFPGKPLADILGKTMIARVIEGVKTSTTLQDIIVATDDDRIATEVLKNNCKFVMTDTDLPSGSDRINQAVKNIDCDVVINIQGDEPLIKGELIDKLAQAMIQNPEIEMATLAHAFTAIEEFESKNTVKVLLNENSNAIYFSRWPIPYSREQFNLDNKVVFKHIGMYAYRKSFLQKFCSMPVADIEQAESLEQLRALSLGAKIKVVVVEQASIGVDSPEDIKKVIELLEV